MAFFPKKAPTKAGFDDDANFSFQQRTAQHSIYKIITLSLCFLLFAGIISCPPPQQQTCNPNNASEFAGCITQESSGEAARTERTGTIPSAPTYSGVSIRFDQLKHGSTLASVSNTVPDLNTQGDATTTFNVFAGEFVSLTCLIDASSEPAAKVFFQIDQAGIYIEDTYIPPLTSSFIRKFKIPTFITSGQVTVLLSIEGSITGNFSNVVAVVLNVVSENDQATPPTTQTITTVTTQVTTATTQTTQTLTTTTQTTVTTLTTTSITTQTITTTSVTTQTVTTVTTATTTNTTRTTTTMTSTTTSMTTSTSSTSTVTSTTNFKDHIIVVGRKTLSTQSDGWIKKFDPNGVEDTINWDKTLAGAYGGNDQLLDVAVDANNNVYVAGVVRELANNYDLWFKKYNVIGVEDTLNWNKVIVGSGINNDWARALIIDSNYVYAAARHGSNGDWWPKKFDLMGIEDTTSEWDNELSEKGDITDIALDGAGNVYLVGQDAASWYHKKMTIAGLNINAGLWGSTGFAGTATAIAIYGSEIYIVGSEGNSGRIRKLNPSGVADTANWDKYISASGGCEPAGLSDVAVDSLGNVFVVGYTEGSCGLVGILLKYDSNGVEDTVNWNKSFASLTNPSGIAIDSMDNVYVIGHNGAGGNWRIKKFNSSGVEDTLNWDKTISTPGTGELMGIAIFK